LTTRANGEAPGRDARGLGYARCCHSYSHSSTSMRRLATSCRPSRHLAYRVSWTSTLLPARSATSVSSTPALGHVDRAECRKSYGLLASGEAAAAGGSARSRAFDEAELAAEDAHCFRDVNSARKAGLHAENAMSGSHVRSDFFATMVLADAHLRTGDVEEACRVALDALDLGEQLKSARCVSYLGEFRQTLRVSSNGDVRFTDQG
jgi:hypothetical protein